MAEDNDKGAAAGGGDGEGGGSGSGSGAGTDASTAAFANEEPPVAADGASSFTVTVRTMGGSTFPLDLPQPGADASVDDLKVAVSKKTGVAPEDQRLIFRGRVLKHGESRSVVSTSCDAVPGAQQHAGSGARCQHTYLLAAACSPFLLTVWSRVAHQGNGGGFAWVPPLR